MHLLLLIYTLIDVAIAQNVFTTGTCMTQRGCGPFPTASPTPPTTISNTIQFTLNRTVTICPTETVSVFGTTSAVSLTRTVNATVVSTLRVTATSTVTINATTTDTEEATTTVTSISTMTLTATIRRTSTIPATSGFVPIASEPGYVPRRRNKRGGDKLVPTAKPDLEKRCWPDIRDVVCNTTIFTLTTQIVTPAGCRPPFPTITVTQSVSVFTVTTTVTTTTGTSTKTERTTVMATVENVITATTTSTWTWTTRHIDWNTTFFATTTLATATTYAACQANNLINSANGGHFIWNINYGGSQNQIQVGIPARNAYECCVACHQTRNCIWSNFPGGCELVIANSCNPNSNFNSSFLTSPDVRRGTTISNGPCGFIANGGDVPLV